MTFLVVALQSEAQPLVRRFGLSACDRTEPFRLYQGDWQGGEVTLVVSGIGRVASAAASAYLFGRAGQPRERPWINIGIAGHREEEVGRAYLAHKISEPASASSWYPRLVFDPPVPTAEVITVDTPEETFAEPALYDMEAAGFFATASRFSRVELIHVLKVISDTRESPVERLTPAIVSGLIEQRLDAATEVLVEARKLS